MQCERIQRGTPLEAKGNEEEEEERGKKKRKRGKKDEHGERRREPPPDSKPISGIVMQQLTRYELW